MCALVHYEPVPSSIPEEKIQLGSGLTEGKRKQVLFVFSKHQKCFPSGEQLGSTSVIDFIIDTSDTKAVRSDPIRFFSTERK